MEHLVSDAAALREKGDFPGAGVKLRRALSKDPQHLPARLLAVQIYIDLGRGDAALGLLKRAREDGATDREILKLRTQAELVAHHYQDVIDGTANLPEDVPKAIRASLQAFRGEALAELGYFQAARSAFDDSLVADPHSVEARVIAGRSAVGRGDIDRARQLLTEAKSLVPKDRQLKKLEGDIDNAVGDYAAAEVMYRAVVDAEPWNEIARGRLAAVQVAEDKLTEAVSTLDAALKGPKLKDVPRHPILHYVRALAAFRQKDYDAAQWNASAVVTSVPGFEPARLIAGASNYALGADEQAYYYLSPYVAANPGDVGAHKLLAATQLRLGKPADAAKTLIPVRNEGSADPELLEMIGIAAARGGDLPTARHYLTLAVEQRPNDGLARTQLGLAEVAAGDANAAIANLELVVNTYPGTSLPQIPLFVAFMQTKDYSKALATAEQLVKSDPGEPIGEMLAAAVYFALDDVEAARMALLRAREIRRGDAAATSNLAKLAMAAGRLDEARHYYMEIIDANPRSIETYLALAELNAKDDRLADAGAALQRGAEANPSEPVIIVALLRFQLSHGAAAAALVGVQEALKKFPRNPELLDVAGTAELALGRPEIALSRFKDLVDVAPELASGHIGLAKAHLSLYTPDNPQWGAVNEAIEAARLKPSDLSAKLVLARALAVHGRLSEARETLGQLKQMKRQDVEVIEIEGLIARIEGRSVEADATLAHAEAIRKGSERRRFAQQSLKLGHAEEASTALTDWLSAHPEDRETRRMWADVCVSSGHLAEAATQYTRLSQEEPGNPILHNNLAWVLSRLNRVEEAIPHAQAAASLQPNSVEFLDTLGAILMQAGKAGEALAPLRLAWSKAADRPDVGFRWSQVLAATGRSHEAVAVLRRILKDQNSAFAERTQAEELLQRLGG